MIHTRFQLYGLALWGQVCKRVTGKSGTISAQEKAALHEHQRSCYYIIHCFVGSDFWKICVFCWHLASSVCSLMGTFSHTDRLTWPIAVLMVTLGPPSSDRNEYGGRMLSSSSTDSTSYSLHSADLEHLFLRI